MPLHEIGLPLGIREARRGSGIVTCKRSRGETRLGVYVINQSTAA